MERKSKIRLIGLTGTNGAGKGEVASYFKKKGYPYFSLSDVIREELKKEEKEASRDNLIQKGNELRKKFGPDILAKRVLKKVKGKALIDSIRNPREVEYLRRRKNFILVAVDAPVEIRYERIRKRGRNESISTLQEFIEKEAEEMGENEEGQQLHRCLQMADKLIINDGNLEDLCQEVEDLL